VGVVVAAWAEAVPALVTNGIRRGSSVDEDAAVAPVTLGFCAPAALAGCPLTSVAGSGSAAAAVAALGAAAEPSAGAVALSPFAPLGGDGVWLASVAGGGEAGCDAAD